MSSDDVETLRMDERRKSKDDFPRASKDGKRSLRLVRRVCERRSSGSHALGSRTEDSIRREIIRGGLIRGLGGSGKRKKGWEGHSRLSNETAKSRAHPSPLEPPLPVPPASFPDSRRAKAAIDLASSLVRPCPSEENSPTKTPSCQ